MVRRKQILLETLYYDSISVCGLLPLRLQRGQRKKKKPFTMTPSPVDELFDQSEDWVIFNVMYWKTTIYQNNHWLFYI